MVDEKMLQVHQYEIKSVPIQAVFWNGSNSDEITRLIEDLPATVLFDGKDPIKELVVRIFYKDYKLVIRNGNVLIRTWENELMKMDYQYFIKLYKRV